jgi:Sulfotransferase family
VLVHIGYHKTGSNWLQRHLFRNSRTGFRWLGKTGGDHPVRQLVRALPFHFDAQATRAQFEPLVRAAESDGLLPVVSYERLSGHPFSGGHDSEQIAYRLKDVFPDAQVLVVIREQRSMIVSTYKQYVKAGGPCSLPRFLLPPRSRSMRVPWFDLAHFEYEHLLRHYRRLFGAERVLTLPYEQFVRDARSFVAAICEFAGRSLDEELLDGLPFTARSNPALPAVEVAIRRRRNHLYVRSELNPAPVLDSRAAKRAARLATAPQVIRLVPERLAASSEAALRREVADLVGDRYRESNRETAELTGLDLAGYGWPV